MKYAFIPLFTVALLIGACASKPTRDEILANQGITEVIYNDYYVGMDNGTNVKAYQNQERFTYYPNGTTNSAIGYFYLKDGSVYSFLEVYYRDDGQIDYSTYFNGFTANREVFTNRLTYDNEGKLLRRDHYYRIGKYDRTGYDLYDYNETGTLLSVSLYVEGEDEVTVTNFHSNGMWESAVLIDDNAGTTVTNQYRDFSSAEENVVQFDEYDLIKNDRYFRSYTFYPDGPTNTVTNIQYVYPDSEDGVLNVIAFDSAGNTTYYSTYDQVYRDFDVQIWHFNEANQVLDIYQAGGSAGMTNFLMMQTNRYTSAGDMTYYSSYIVQPDMIAEEYYEKDYDGELLLSEIYYYNDGGFEFRSATDYEYNSNSDVTYMKYAEFSEETTNLYVNRFEYDYMEGTTNITEIRTYDETDALIGINTYKYDDRGNVYLQEATEIIENITNYSQYRSVYDEVGRVLENASYENGALTGLEEMYYYYKWGEPSPSVERVSDSIPLTDSISSAKNLGNSMGF